jgi:hypothetical protein
VHHIRSSNILIFNLIHLSFRISVD